MWFFLFSLLQVSVTGVQTSWHVRQGKPWCSSLGLWFTSHLDIWGHCIFTVHLCLPTPLLPGLLTSLVLSYGSLLPFVFFFSLSVFFSSLCEGKISTKKMSAGMNWVAPYFPWVCGVAALLPRKHLGVGHLCIQPPALSSHPYCCWHKPSCFRWTIHKLNFPEK